MSELDPPDSVPRSPSGRVPKWVLDQAAGEAPTELIPFRAPEPLPPYFTPPNEESKSSSRQWVSLAVALVLVASLLGYSVTRGSKDEPAAKPLPTPTPVIGTTNSPTPGFEELGRPLGQPVVVGGLTSDRYRFGAHQPDGLTPATWSPCRPIHYVIRPENEPIEGPRLLAEAFARLSIATGFVFRNDGFATEAPRDDRPAVQRELYGDRWAPVLIAWATDDEVPEFATDVVGAASPMRVTSPSGVVTFVTGTVTFDASALKRIAQQEGFLQARAIVMHELAHLVGLSHVNDLTQVMAPKHQQNGPTEYQAGDVAGLARLGSGPCRPDV